MKFLPRLTLAACLTACALAGAQPADPLAPIATLDVGRYLGTWYEVAKYPNRFQSQCASDTRADYSLLPGGDLQVRNQCRLRNGQWEEAVGRARRTDPASPAKLQVRFAPAWLSLLPFVWGDYWVIDLDEAYELAAVSEPRREFLWILSRTPQVPPGRYDALLARLAARGFDLRKLELSPQTGQPR